MSRESIDFIDCDGITFDGYDYDLQVWVRNYIVENCGHPASMRPGCCNGDRYAGEDIRNVEHSRRCFVCGVAWDTCDCGVVN